MQIAMLIIITVVLMFQIIVLLSANNVLIDIRANLKEILEKMSHDVTLDTFHRYNENDVETKAALYKSQQNSMKVYNEALNVLQNYNHDSIGERKDPPDIFLSSKVEAEGVAIRLKELMAQFGVVLLVDLYDLVDIRSSFEDSKWGWDDLSSLVPVIVEDEVTKKTQWSLDFPKMKPIADMQVKVLLKNLLGDIEKNVKNIPNKEKHDFDI